MIGCLSDNKELHKIFVIAFILLSIILIKKCKLALSCSVIEVAMTGARSLIFIADTSTARMINIPKIQRTFCKKCSKHQPHKVTQYK